MFSLVVIWLNGHAIWDDFKMSHKSEGNCSHYIDRVE
jgi:hypothetical protein